MKRRIAYILSLLLMAQFAAAQTVSRYEYWVDNDYAGHHTGYGTKAEETISFQFDINGLTDGIHLLYMRAANSAGQVSGFKHWLFYKPEASDADVNLTGYEYWIDNDYANRTRTASSNSNPSFMVDISNLTPGVHMLYCRAMNDAGINGVIKNWLFYKPEASDADVNLTGYEYWIDNDYANRTRTASSSSSPSFMADISNFTPGVHMLYCRAINDAGVYGVVKHWLFYKPEASDADVNLTGYEYWIDNDYSNRTRTASSNSNPSFMVDISNLTPGVHMMYCRAINDAGVYGVIKNWLFYKPSESVGDDEISGYEYWIDNDYAGRTVWNYPPEDPEYLFIDTENLKQGVHQLYFRAFTKSGKVGSVSNWMFYIPDYSMQEAVESSPLVGYRYNFNGVSAYVEIPECDEYDMNGFLFDIPELTQMASVDENCTFSFNTANDSVILTRTTKVGFGIQFHTKAGGWTAPVTYGYEEDDVLRRKASLLPLQQTVTFSKRNRGDMDVFRLDVTASGTYYLRASQSCKLMLFNAKDGSLYKTIEPAEITGSYRTAFSKGTYYGVVTETVVDASNTSDVVSVRFMENDNFVPTPVISYENETVTLSCENTDATIYYTLDGTDPTEQSNVYTEPFEFKHNGTIKVVAKYDGMADSYIAMLKVDSYTVTDPVVAFANLKVYITTTTDNARIYYTTDGSDPIENGKLYTAPFSIEGNLTVRAVAVRDDFHNSQKVEVFIDISGVKCVTPSFSVTDDVLTITTLTEGAIIWFTMDGSRPTRESNRYEGPVTLEMNGTVRAFAVMEGAIDSDMGEYTVDWFRLARPSISFSEQTQLVTMSSVRPEAVIYYTIDGSEPTVSSSRYEAPFKLEHNAMIIAFGVCEHFMDSWLDTLIVDSYKVAVPEISRVGGNMVMTCSTPGAVVYFTVDGSDPVIGGTLYDGPVAIDRICTIKAVAIKADFNNSDLAVYELGKCAAPTFECADNVLAMATATDGARIYYTVDGSKPDSLCTLYTSPIRLEKNQTFKAVASMPGTVDSDVKEFAVDWFKVEKPEFAFTGGYLAITCATSGSIIHYEIGGGEPTLQSAVYSAPIELIDNRIVRAFAVKPDFNDSEVGAYEPDYFKCAAPEISFDGRSVTLTTATEGSRIYYTVNGQTPTSASSVYSAPVQLDGLLTVKAFTVKDYFIDSEFASFTLPCYYNGDTVYVANVGTLSKAFEWCGTDGIEDVVLKGKLGENDFACLRGMGQLRYLDLSEASAVGDSLPSGAFRNTSLVSVSTPKVLESAGHDLFGDCDAIAAVQWNADIMVPDDLLGGAQKPNLLLYVKSGSYVRAGVFTNVVVNGITDLLTLTDSETSDFWCPVEFTARKATYTHTYTMQTEKGQCTGWESIALPFTVSLITHAINGKMAPFGADSDADKPFWLEKLTEDGFVPAHVIEANTPYIICMPNNEMYADKYILAGEVTFQSTNVKVEASSGIKTSTKGSVSLVPNYSNGSSNGRSELNVGMEYQGHRQGSLFVKDLRRVKPFEAYVVAGSHAAKIMIRDLLDDIPDGINRIFMDGAADYGTQGVYDMNGRKVSTDVIDYLNTGGNTPDGIIIIDGRKVLIR